MLSLFSMFCSSSNSDNITFMVTRSNIKKALDNADSNQKLHNHQQAEKQRWSIPMLECICFQQTQGGAANLFEDQTGGGAAS